MKIKEYLLDEEQLPKLSKEQIEKYKKKMVKNGVPVRFLHNGNSLNIVTGEITKKGTNIMYQIVYWNFDKETAKEIANILGVKAVFS